MKIGIDIGSTTIKCVVLDDSGALVSQSYERHFSQITEKAAEMLRRIRQQYPQQSAVPLSITGSAGMGMATSCGIPFIQEVYATAWQPILICPARM